MRLPESILTDEGVGENCELSHDGGDGDFGLFSAGDETVVEGFQVRIVPSGAVGWHIESGPDIGPSASDGAGSAALAAVVGDGGKAIMAISLAESWPSSITPAMRATAAHGPTPGIEVRISKRRARAGSASIRRRISASRLAMAVSRARN